MDTPKFKLDDTKTPVMTQAYKCQECGRLIADIAFDQTGDSFQVPEHLNYMKTAICNRGGTVYRPGEDASMSTPLAPDRQLVSAR